MVGTVVPTVLGSMSYAGSSTTSLKGWSAITVVKF